MNLNRRFSAIILLLISILLLTACQGHAQSHGKEGESNHSHPYSSKDDDSFKIVIDPGHGGRDRGATGADGKYEKEFTLDLAQKVEHLLKKESGIKSYMTREDDTFLSQESRYRPKYANEKDADVFISLHENTIDDPNVSGTQSFYYHGHSRHFAKIMQKYVSEATGFDDRGTKKQDLFVVRDTNMPAVLIEEGFITNPEDEDKLNKDEFQDHVADSIVQGIKAYRKEVNENGLLSFMH